MGVVASKGIRDWVIQRVSAVVMLLYIAMLVVVIALHSPLDFATWQALFSTAWLKVFSILFMLSLCYHAWIGLWTIYTDYVNCFCGRSFLNIVTILALIGYFIGFVQIVWGV
jgi:succinate dehydrogenase / fumarate reductase, membrane anchor subunit